MKSSGTSHRPVAALMLLLAAVALPSATGLEVREGRLSLVLHEDTGRFSLYALRDIRTVDLVPLFFDKDPRTTYATLLINDRSLRLGATAGFTLEAVRTLGGAEFVWKSPTMEIIQSFTFVASRGAPLVDGLHVGLRVRNLGDEGIRLGLRYLIDTNLGERATAHFTTADGTAISAETFLTPGPRIPYWGSSSEAAELRFHMVGGDLTAPEEVVFANWKRLNDGPWRYTPVAGRTFNLPPYSINDSAAAIYYREQALPRGDARDFRFIMAVGAGAEFAEADARSGLNALLRQAATAPEAAGSDREAAIRRDLLTLDSLIEKINQLLARAGPPTADELAILRRTLAELEQRRSTYQLRP